MSFSWRWRLSDLKPPEPDAPTVFSTFSCGGGSSMGYKRAGFDVVGCCEIDPKINAVYKANLHPRLNYVMDLREFNRQKDLPPDLFSLDILDGSPPCSTFSMAGDREDAWGRKKKFAEGQKLQRLDDLFFVFLDTVELLKPRVVIAENVEGLLRGNARGYVSEIIDRFHGLGYQVQMFKLDSQFADVPQRRVRVFFIATKEDKPKLKLDFSHERIPFGKVRSKHGVPLRDDSAIKKVLDKRLPSERRLSETALRLTGEHKLYTHAILVDHEVAPTVTAVFQQYRMCDGQRLSIEDIRNISSFPQDYDFMTSVASRVNFICGMSVPPNLMANVAEQVRLQWLNG